MLSDKTTHKAIHNAAKVVEEGDTQVRLGALQKLAVTHRALKSTLPPAPAQAETNILGLVIGILIGLSLLAAIIVASYNVVIKKKKLQRVGKYTS